MNEASHPLWIERLDPHLKTLSVLGSKDGQEGRASGDVCGCCVGYTAGSGRGLWGGRQRLRESPGHGLELSELQT